MFWTILTIITSAIVIVTACKSIKDDLQNYINNNRDDNK